MTTLYKENTFSNIEMVRIESTDSLHKYSISFTCKEKIIDSEDVNLALKAILRASSGG